MTRVILSGGGTGGHIFPALALAEELRRRSPETKILFLGGDYGPEGQMAAKAGLDFAALPARGFIGRGFTRSVGAALRLAGAVGKAVNILRRFQPEVVVGFGGYAAVAGLLAAFLRGTPCLVHEQNSIPGTANRLLGKMARRVCLSFQGAEQWFPQGKCVFTGNPVRRAVNILRPPRSEARHILVLGGSQGARAVNDAALEDLELLLQAGFRLRLQSGSRDFERVRERTVAYAEEQVKVEAFIDDMAEAYAWADLAVCRAGATTLAELAAAALPALLIPLPLAAHNHQWVNAEAFRKLGAARLLEQKDLGPGILARLARETLGDKDMLRSMSTAARLLARPEAAQKLADEAESLAVRPADKKRV
ncbi:MAG: undecaprenyldiphospho-muramoylpentapeptide beta-N-acetylglucosaminyltransferase [Deltaproteobacteria bacterium]|nr:undecaprenyldiphospho-muramoylpentapeptide beta-N-acetylglucosaminyltransferase [Deltaproteobacteria bacterium]